MFLRSRIYGLLERAAPDVLSAQLRFFRAHRRLARLRRPQSFSEFVTRRALFDHDPRFAKLADKIEAKRQVAETLGPAWIIPSLYEGETLPPLGRRSWPFPFVIKASHGSGMNLFIRSARDADWLRIEAIVQGWLSQDFSQVFRERFYRAIQPRILVEPLIGDPAVLPTDIKFFCFAGEPLYVMVQTDRAKALKIAVMDPQWRMLPLRYTYPQPDETPAPPVNLARLTEAARRLSKPFDFVRVDFYELDEKPLFGEFTFTPGAGLETFEPYRFNLEFGAHWRAAQAAVRRT